MSLRDKLNKVATRAELFPELTNAEKEKNRLLVSIANAICFRRKELKSTQAQLAQMLSVSQPMVCKWENGEYNFTIETLATVFDKLKLKIDISFTPVEEAEVIPRISRYDVKPQRTKKAYYGDISGALEEAA